MSGVLHNAVPIKNPYSSSSTAATAARRTTFDQNMEGRIQNWLRSSGIPSLSSIETLQEQLHREPIQWSVDLAKNLGSLVLRCLRYTGSIENDNIVRVRCSLLELLATVMDGWEDHSIYAVLVQEDSDRNPAATEYLHPRTNDDASSLDGVNLLDALTQLSVPSSNLGNDSGDENAASIRPMATVCLSIAWRCLDRLEDFTIQSTQQRQQQTIRSPWWIPDGEKTRNSLTAASFQSLCHLYGCSDLQDGGFHSQNQRYRHPDQEKMSSLSILVVLLKYQLVDLSNCDFILPADGNLPELISKLIKGIQILNHSVLPPSSSKYTLPIAILSMSILSLLQRSLEQNSLFHGLDQTIQSTGLVENIVQCAFPGDGNHSSAPRWASSIRFPKGYLTRFGLQLFSCWSLCDNAAWNVLVTNLQPKLASFVDPFWSSLGKKLSEKKSSEMEDQLPRILWLYTHMNGPARCRLDAILETMFHNTATESPMEAHPDDMNNPSPLKIMLLSLFGALRLSSGASYSTRCMVSRLLTILLSDRRMLSNHDALSRSLWEALDRLAVECHLEAVLEHADTEDVNQPLLLALADTLQTLLEYRDTTSQLIDQLSAHHLEALIYIIKPRDIRYDFGVEDEQDNNDKEQTPPLHNLSRMDETSICIEHEEIKSPRGLDHSVRLSVATGLAHLSYGGASSSQDESACLLISRISQAVNDCLVEYHTLFEEGELSIDPTKRFVRLHQTVATPESEEFLSNLTVTGASLRKAKEEEWKTEQEEIENKLQVALDREKSAQKEIARLRHKLQKQSILFQRELSRKKVNNAQDARQIVSMHVSERAKAEARSKNFQQQAETARLELERVQIEAQTTMEELKKTRSELNELHDTVDSVRQQLEHETIKATNALQEVEANKAALESVEEKFGDLQNAIEEKEGAISHMEDKNLQLQDNLEDLFADMCSLAQIYQHNEGQEESNAKAIETVNQKIAEERRKNEELSFKMKNIEEENEKLYRKLGKYKERLEQERNERKALHDKRKEDVQRRKRNGPVSYLNSLHNTSTSDSTVSRSSRDSSSQQRPPSRNNSERPPSQYTKYSSLDRSSSTNYFEKENGRSSSNHQRGSRSQRRTVDY